ncbi:hypothetical protein CSUI_005361 [Cystoisospora suis]|uniref:Secreted protein n=1 Tax=Cystoisospora suis TaxID=483139 RepID=A0A2C6K6P4_9APIC|nr:hypothetical protein CSUI_005361 [Cystoisospora suis]
MLSFFLSLSLFLSFSSLHAVTRRDENADRVDRDPGQGHHFHSSYTEVLFILYPLLSKRLLEQRWILIRPIGERTRHILRVSLESGEKDLTLSSCETPAKSLSRLTSGRIHLDSRSEDRRDSR